MLQYIGVEIWAARISAKMIGQGGLGGLFWHVGRILIHLGWRVTQIKAFVSWC
jgi:hypothetical protein